MLRDEDIKQAFDTLADQGDQAKALSAIQARVRGTRRRRALLMTGGGVVIILALGGLTYGVLEDFRAEPRLIITEDEIQDPRGGTTPPAEEIMDAEVIQEPDSAGWRIYPPVSLPQFSFGPGAMVNFDGEFILTQFLPPAPSDYAGARLFIIRLIEGEGEARTESKFLAGTYAALFGGSDGGRVVWSTSGDPNSPDSPPSEIEVNLFDWDEGVAWPLTDNDRLDGDARISGRWVVWSEGADLALPGNTEPDARIVVHDLDTGENLPLAQSGENTAPSVVAPHLVWQRRVSAGWEVWYRNLESGREQRLAGPFQADHPPLPMADKDAAVWVEGDGQEGRVMLVELGPDEVGRARALPFPGTVERAGLGGQVIVAQVVPPDDEDSRPTLLLFDRQRERVLRVDSEEAVWLPLDLVAFGDDLVAWMQPKSDGWIISAYDARAGKMVRLAEYDGSLRDPALIVPKAAGRRVLWMAPDMHQVELREAPY